MGPSLHDVMEFKEQSSEPIIYIRRTPEPSPVGKDLRRRRFDGLIMYIMFHPQKPIPVTLTSSGFWESSF